MIQGLNTEVRHRGRLCHVQTEDSGPQNPTLTTHIFLGGKIIVSVRKDYREDLGRSDLDDYLHRVMLEQHSQVEADLTAGKYDNEMRGMGSMRSDIPLARKSRQNTSKVPEVKPRPDESIVPDSSRESSFENSQKPSEIEPPGMSISTSRDFISMPPAAVEEDEILNASISTGFGREGSFRQPVTGIFAGAPSVNDRPAFEPLRTTSSMPRLPTSGAYTISETLPRVSNSGNTSNRVLNSTGAMMMITPAGRSGQKPPPLPTEVQRTPLPVRPAGSRLSVLSSSTDLNLNDFRAGLASRIGIDLRYRTLHPAQPLLDPLLLADLLDSEEF